MAITRSDVEQQFGHLCYKLGAQKAPQALKFCHITKKYSLIWKGYSCHQLRKPINTRDMFFYLTAAISILNNFGDAQ